MAKSSAAKKPAASKDQIDKFVGENAAPVTTARPSRNTVTVACKMPNGLILRMTREESYSEPVMGGGMRELKRWAPTGEQVRVNGPATPHGKTPNFLIVGGYALTSNVPKEFWDEWLRQNKASDLVTGKMIYAHDAIERVSDQAKEFRGTRSGLEPLDTGRKTEKGRSVPSDPRYPRSIRPEVGEIEDGAKT